MVTKEQIANRTEELRQRARLREAIAKFSDKPEGNPGYLELLRVRDAANTLIALRRPKP